MIQNTDKTCLEFQVWTIPKDSTATFTEVTKVTSLQWNNLDFSSTDTNSLTESCHTVWRFHLVKTTLSFWGALSTLDRKVWVCLSWVSNVLFLILNSSTRLVPPKNTPCLKDCFSSTWLTTKELYSCSQTTTLKRASKWRWLSQAWRTARLMVLLEIQSKLS